MAFTFMELDTKVRDYMLNELEFDIEKGSLYISPRLNEQGRLEYSELLKVAFRTGTEETLALELSERRILSETEYRRNPKGGGTMVKVPISAHQMLAEGEFNRFYVRAICRLAIEEGAANLEVYRAKEVAHPRSGSEAKIGTLVPAKDLLLDLRTNPGIEPALGLPPGPNSGLSVKRA